MNERMNIRIFICR